MEKTQVIILPDYSNFVKCCLSISRKTSKLISAERIFQDGKTTKQFFRFSPDFFIKISITACRNKDLQLIFNDEIKKILLPPGT